MPLNQTLPPVIEALKRAEFELMVAIDPVTGVEELFVSRKLAEIRDDVRMHRRQLERWLEFGS